MAFNDHYVDNDGVVMSDCPTAYTLDRGVDVLCVELPC